METEGSARERKGEEGNKKEERDGVALRGWGRGGQEMRRGREGEKRDRQMEKERDWGNGLRN